MAFQFWYRDTCIVDVEFHLLWTSNIGHQEYSSKLVYSIIFVFRSTINKPSTPQTLNTSCFILCTRHILLLDKNSSVSDLTVLEVMESLLNTLLIERVLHGSGGDVLSGDKLKKLADAVTRSNKGSLDTDTLERELSQGNGSGL
jgi:hypothetical protein